MQCRHALLSCLLLSAQLHPAPALCTQSASQYAAEQATHDPDATSSTEQPEQTSAQSDTSRDFEVLDDQTPPETPDDARERRQRNEGKASTIFEYLEPQLRDARASDWPFGSSLEPYQQFKRGLRDDIDLAYALSYSPIFQASTAGSATANHEIDFVGTWRILESPSAGSGQLNWWFLNVVTYGGKTTREFADDLGIISEPNDGDTSPDRVLNRLGYLKWDQSVLDGTLQFSVGKLGLNERFGNNRFAHDDRQDFLNLTLLRSATSRSAQVGGSLGAAFTVFQPDWYVSAAIADATASNDFIDFSSVGDGRFLYVVEPAWTPHFESLGQGNYRLTLEYADRIGDRPDQAAGYSLGVSIDQDLGPEFGAFFRYSRAWEQLREIEQYVGGGLVFQSPGGWEDDRIGIAGWWAQPSNAEFRDEYGVEVFYRAQMTTRIELSADVQVIINPAKDRTRSLVPIFGLRLRVVF